MVENKKHSKAKGMGSITKLDDFGIGQPSLEERIEERIESYTEKAKLLPPELRADYWRFEVWANDDEVCQFMTGKDYHNLQKYRKRNGLNQGVK